MPCMYLTRQQAAAEISGLDVDKPFDWMPNTVECRIIGNRWIEIGAITLHNWRMVKDFKDPFDEFFVTNAASGCFMHPFSGIPHAEELAVVTVNYDFLGISRC